MMNKTDVRLKVWRGLGLAGAVAGWVMVGCATKSHGQTTAAVNSLPPGSTSLEHVFDLQQKSPYRGYLEAHDHLQKPLAVLGGPTRVTIAQDRGKVHVALPDHRRLDPNVFGTPAMPRAYGGTPIAEGVPPGQRQASLGQYTRLKKKTPFGHAYLTLGGAQLNVTLEDETATDAAHSDDTVQFDASWKDASGNVYEVRCQKVYPHGTLDGHPTFGGVVLNHLMHGSSRVGTPLMPTLFCYAAFWGPGEVLKNGEVLDRNRLVHGMLTENVRGRNYRLDFDSQVDPRHLLFHLMVPPMKNGKPDPVRTGFRLKNGKPLPFWHVMFDHLTIHVKHQEQTTKFPEMSKPVESTPPSKPKSKPAPSASTSSHQ